MKFVLGFVLLFAAADTFAWEPDHSKNLADLLYIPNAGRLYGDTRMEWQTSAGSIETGSGEVDFTEGTNTFSQQLGYGITERSQLFFKYSNQLKGRTAIEANGNSDEEGPANPELGALFRVLKQEEDSITLDVLLAYSPDLLDSESNSTKDESDAASGGSAITLGGRAGKKFTNLEMMGELLLTVNGDSESKDTVDDSKTKRDSFATSTIAYSVQLPLEKGFWVRGRLEGRTQGEIKAKDGDGDKVKQDAVTFSSLELSLLYSPIDDHLVLMIGAGIGGASDFKRKYDDGTVNKFEDISGNIAYLAARYQF